MNGVSNGGAETGSRDGLITWTRDGTVRLRMSGSGPAAEPPITVMEALRETVEKAPKRFAVAVKNSGAWSGYTYQSYYDTILTVSRAFIRLGLEPHRGVGILGFNSPEWFITNLATIFAGGISTGIYATNSAEACQYVLEDAECQIVVVENDYQLRKILQVKDRLPHLRTIIQYKGTSSSDCPDVLTWDAMMEFGKPGDEELADELQRRMREQKPNQCCTLIYTSGTTGNPKGTMLSHDNLTWTAKTILRYAKTRFGTEMIISYLPLSHIAAQMLDIYSAMMGGATVHFAQPDAMKGSLNETIKEVRPTSFLGVTRVWEKMQDAILAHARGSMQLKKKAFNWALEVGLNNNLSLMNGLPQLLMYPTAKKLVFDKLRKAMGFDRCHVFLCGAAPIRMETLTFFMSVDMPIMEIFGMTESTGLQMMDMPWCYYIGSVGRELPGIQSKLAKVNEETGDGELCAYGRNVFMGYLNNPEETKKAIDEEGWLHSGDIGRKDKAGFVYVTGRIKELIITAGGENIPPVLIEDKVKEALPCVSNCMLIGDKRKFLSMLLTLKTTVDPNTMEPTDQLTREAIEWCRRNGSPSTKVSHIIDNNDEKVLGAIQKGIDLVNKMATSHAQCIQKWTILPKDFSIGGGEFGPTLKMKRPEILRMYASVIDEFYE